MGTRQILLVHKQTNTQTDLRESNWAGDGGRIITLRIYPFNSRLRRPLGSGISTRGSMTREEIWSPQSKTRGMKHIYIALMLMGKSN